MRQDTDNLIALLAASGFSEKDIYCMLISVQEINPRLLIDEISRIRGVIRSKRAAGKDVTSNPYHRDEQMRGHIDRICALLLTEAALPPNEAAVRLRGSIAASTSASKLPSFRPKEGFKNWLVKLLDLMSPSELLHHATRVRNTTIHQDTSDWPLRDR